MVIIRTLYELKDQSHQDCNAQPYAIDTENKKAAGGNEPEQSAHDDNPN